MSVTPVTVSRPFNERRIRPTIFFNRETDFRVDREDPSAGAGELSPVDAAEADQRRRHADRSDVPADAGRSASRSQGPWPGLLSGSCIQDAETRGQSQPQMHISKEGDPYLRTLWYKEPSTFWLRLVLTVIYGSGGLTLVEREGKSGKKRAVS